jgi:hypothetical protein
MAIFLLVVTVAHFFSAVCEKVGEFWPETGEFG